jgi:hypothetical protein
MPLLAVVTGEHQIYLQHAFANGLNLSASFAVYRPQADVFGGRFDGKFVARLGKH